MTRIGYVLWWIAYLLIGSWLGWPRRPPKIIG